MRALFRTSVVVFLAGSNHAFSFVPKPTSVNRISQTRTTNSADGCIFMSGFPHAEEDIPTKNTNKRKLSKKSHSELSAFALDTAQDVLSVDTQHDDYEDISSVLLTQQPTSSITTTSFLQDSVFPVLSTAFLITANTVGASCLILPDLAAGPGFLPTCLISLGVYLINLVSGLILAEVAIKQYESSGSDVPSSFKEFADKSFNSDVVANIISAISVLTNACVLVFTFAKAGDMTSNLVGGGIIDPTVASLGFVSLLGVMMSTFTAGNLSAVASICVGALFISFGGVLIPGLAAVQDPLSTLTAPGTVDPSLMMSSVGQVIPIILLSLVYQNIVPSVTKILNYDRQKTVASLALGSFIPLAMYLLFCFASLGGGIDTSSVGAAAGPLMTGFTISTILGSSVGTTMSIAEEFDSFLKPNNKNGSPPPEDDSEDYVFSVPAVAAALAVPVLGNMIGGEDITSVLSLAGSFGSPLLYGVVPAIMAFNQRQEEKRQQNLVPGGFASLGALGLAAGGFVGQELAHVMDAVALSVA